MKFKFIMLLGLCIFSINIFADDEGRISYNKLGPRHSVVTNAWLDARSDITNYMGKVIDHINDHLPGIVTNVVDGILAPSECMCETNKMVDGVIIVKTNNLNVASHSTTKLMMPVVKDEEFVPRVEVETSAPSGLRNFSIVLDESCVVPVYLNLQHIKDEGCTLFSNYEITNNIDGNQIGITITEIPAMVEFKQFGNNVYVNISKLSTK